MDCFAEGNVVLNSPICLLQTLSWHRALLWKCRARSFLCLPHTLVALVHYFLRFYLCGQLTCRNGAYGRNRELVLELDGRKVEAIKKWCFFSKVAPKSGEWSWCAWAPLLPSPTSLLHCVSLKFICWRPNSLYHREWPCLDRVITRCDHKMWLDEVMLK